jgi:hypothetical protein
MDCTVYVIDNFLKVVHTVYNWSEELAHSYAKQLSQDPNASFSAVKVVREDGLTYLIVRRKTFLRVKPDYRPGDEIQLAAFGA